MADEDAAILHRLSASGAQSTTMFRRAGQSPSRTKPLLQIPRCASSDPWRLPGIAGRIAVSQAPADVCQLTPWRHRLGELSPRKGRRPATFAGHPLPAALPADDWSWVRPLSDGGIFQVEPGSGELSTLLCQIRVARNRAGGHDPVIIAARLAVIGLGVGQAVTGNTMPLIQ
jgi:hypothetical protein